MCAPTKDLAKIAIAGAAIYATGGAAAGSILSTSGGSMATTATTSSFASSIASTYNAVTSSGLFKTLSTVSKIATPILGAVGSIYTGYMNAAMLETQANFVDYSIIQEGEAAGLRKTQRDRAKRKALAEQYAKYSQTGITLEGTPTDILGETSAKFAEDQFVDDYNTALKITTQKFSASQLRAEAQAAQLGGFVNAAMVLGTRGLPKKGKQNIFTEIPMGEGETF